MIKIQKSKTADARSCDYTRVPIQRLLESSVQHINDVHCGLEFIKGKFDDAIILHDHDKISGILGFHRDFVTGFKKSDWWDNHRKVNRHHLLQEDGIPKDVNLIDVIEMIVDCVMAGMGRTGSVYPLNIPPEVLKLAFDNTVDLVKDQVEVEE